jgi:hypothetical protein
MDGVLNIQVGMRLAEDGANTLFGCLLGIRFKAKVSTGRCDDIVAS